MAGFLVMTIPGIFRRQEKDPAQEQEISALTEEFFPVRGSFSFNQELDMAPGGKQHQAEGPENISDLKIRIYTRSSVQYHPHILRVHCPLFYISFLNSPYRPVHFPPVARRIFQLTV